MPTMTNTLAASIRISKPSKVLNVWTNMARSQCPTPTLIIQPNQSQIMKDLGFKLGAGARILP